MLVSEAFADSPPASAGAPAGPVTTTVTTTATPEQANIPADAAPSPLSGLGVFLILIPIFYFLIIRPNQKKIKDYETMVTALRRGDRVVTGGGIIGVITKIENDDVLVVEIAPDIKVRVMRETISHVINKTAVNDNKVDDKPTKSDEKASN